MRLLWVWLVCMCMLGRSFDVCDCVWLRRVCVLACVRPRGEQYWWGRGARGVVVNMCFGVTLRVSDGITTPHARIHQYTQIIVLCWFQFSVPTSLWLVPRMGLICHPVLTLPSPTWLCVCVLESCHPGWRLQAKGCALGFVCVWVSLLNPHHHFIPQM